VKGSNAMLAARKRVSEWCNDSWVIRRLVKKGETLGRGKSHSSKRLSEEMSNAKYYWMIQSTDDSRLPSKKIDAGNGKKEKRSRGDRHPIRERRNLLADPFEFL